MTGDNRSPFRGEFLRFSSCTCLYLKKCAVVIVIVFVGEADFVTIAVRSDWKELTRGKGYM